MEARTTLRFYLIPVRMATAKMKTKTNSNSKLPINKGQETLTSIQKNKNMNSLFVELHNGTAIMKTRLTFP